MKLHEIERGVWIVPELVFSVDTAISYMDYTYKIRVHCVLNDAPIVVREGQARIESTPNRPPGNSVSFIVLDDVKTLANDAAAEVAAWIDERRTEPLLLEKA